MKIVEIIPSIYPLGGAERLVCNLLTNFRKKGHDVYLISLYSNYNKEIIEELHESNVTMYFLNKVKGIDLKCARALKETIKAINPDVVHAHLDSIVTIWLSRIYKKYKIFYTFHTLINKKVLGSKIKIKNILYRKLLQKKKILPVAISDTIKFSILNYYSLNSNYVCVVYNGVPIEKFKNDNCYKRRHYDFIFAGRFIEIKNPDLILRSFINVSKKNPNVNMLFAGDGILLEKCKQIAEYEKNANITFVGFVNDISKYLVDSKFLVLASDYEGNPIIVNEGIAAKCFVLATKVGGISDVINKNNGLLIDLDDFLIEKLTNAMFYCISNAETIEKNLDREYQNNIAKVSIEKTIDNYVNVFREEEL